MKMSSRYALWDYRARCLIEAMNVANLVILKFSVAGRGDQAMGIFKKGSVAREDAILALSKRGDCCPVRSQTNLLDR